MSVSALPHFHAGTPQDALAATGSSETGLSQVAAEARLAEDGPNALPRALGPPAVHAPIQQRLDPLGHVIDAAVILAVVLVNATIGFLQVSGRSVSRFNLR